MFIHMDVLALLTWTFSIGYTQTTGPPVAATVQCTSCTTYQLTVGSDSQLLNCPLGTVCSTSSTSLCAASNACDGVVCNHYAVFPSASNCQEFHLCRYRTGFGYILTTATCPGNSRFDVKSNKCSLSEYVTCYTVTSVTSTVATATTMSAVPSSTVL